MATWCQREETPDHPLSEKDKKDLQFLYDEWAHPYFISIEEYKRIIEVGASLCFAALRPPGDVPVRFAKVQQYYGCHLFLGHVSSRSSSSFRYNMLDMGRTCL